MKMFTLYLGSNRPDARPTLQRVLMENFESFSILSGEGFFRRNPEPMWMIKVGTTEPGKVFAVIDQLRRLLEQEGVGLEYEGRYVSVKANSDPAVITKLLRIQEA